MLIIKRTTLLPINYYYGISVLAKNEAVLISISRYTVFLVYRPTLLLITHGLLNSEVWWFSRVPNWQYYTCTLTVTQIHIYSVHSDIDTHTQIHVNIHTDTQTCILRIDKGEKLKKVKLKISKASIISYLEIHIVWLRNWPVERKCCPE